MKLAWMLFLMLYGVVSEASPIAINTTQEIRVKRGTPVTLKLVETLSTSTLDKDHIVLLEIYLDVVVDGKVAAVTGAYAEGYVVGIKPRGLLGKGSSVEIRALNAQCIDGQRMILSGLPYNKSSDRRKARFSLGMLLSGLLILMLGAALGGNPGLLLVGGIMFISGLLVQGNEVEIPVGTTLTATVAEEIVIKEL
ncbi:MAG: hypothetical protein HC892_03645 [Saprospiraceae bacterium]|nr:hypothetical protein [Saprospiraceae bacterium]